MRFIVYCKNFTKKTFTFEHLSERRPIKLSIPYIPVLYKMFLVHSWILCLIWFQVLRECSSKALRNSAMQIFFYDTNQQPVFGCVAGVYFFIMLSKLRFVKWVRFFERNCIVKWVNPFASFDLVSSLINWLWN